ncbi:MAG: HAD-IB family phosphatase, partial [Candidatus Kerfeldbacteria bacterium]|nr:HAD-IB family phosphatase [Candidatus Kerfeldbacteria bacterium]
GSDVVALTAPFTSFVFPLGFWFKRMGFVDIQRDSDDEANHPTANPKTVAFTKLLHYLGQGTSLFMFPEGHVERGHLLHYIHTGVARLSLRAHVPVQVMTLVGGENTYLGHGALLPGILTLRFGKLMQPPSLSVYLPFRKVVKPYAQDIERRLVAMLPVRYLPDYYGKQPNGIAAFVDIDHTLYLGYAQQDFIRYLLKKKLLPRSLPLRVLYWILLEHLRLLPHRQLMKLAYSSLSGLPIKQINRLCEQFFQEVAIHKINHALLPVIKDHQAKGHIVVVVTEIFHPLAHLFQHYLDSVACLDTILAQQHGHYTGDIELLNYGYAKAEQVEKFARLFNVDLARSYAYADATSDLPMLYTCRHKIPVHPDKHLQRVAQQQHWQTL